ARAPSPWLLLQRSAAIRSPPPVRCFFSSRRRHTRSKRDWSSDVCSSDLEFGVPQGRGRVAGPVPRTPPAEHQTHRQRLRHHSVEIGRASCRERAHVEEAPAPCEATLPLIRLASISRTSTNICVLQARIWT